MWVCFERYVISKGILNQHYFNILNLFFKKCFFCSYYFSLWSKRFCYLRILSMPFSSACFHKHAEKQFLCVKSTHTKKHIFMFVWSQKLKFLGNMIRSFRKPLRYTWQATLFKYFLIDFHARACCNITCDQIWNKRGNLFCYCNEIFI